MPPMVVHNFEFYASGEIQADAAWTLRVPRHALLGGSDDANSGRSDRYIARP